MKVSMSTALEGLEVTVSAQLHHEGSSRGALVSRLAAQGAYIEDEGLEILQEIVRTSMPEALLQADSTLRIAIEERLLSQMRQSRESSFSELAKDYEDVAYSPAAHRPRTEIVVVFGDKCGGDTPNADRLRKHFNAAQLIDLSGLPSPVSILKPGRTLILTSHSISDVLEAIFGTTQVVPPSAGIDSIRLISFYAAMQELN